VSGPLGVALLGGALGYVVLAVYVAAHRRVAGAVPLAGMLVSVGIWTTCYGMELSSQDVPTAMIWAGVKFVGVVTLAPELWSFVLQYTGDGGPLPRRMLGLLLIEPVAVLLLLAIPQTHDLIHYYPDDPAAVRYTGGAPVAETGPLFWAHATYTYVLLFGAVGMLVARLVRISRPYRRQAVFLIISTVLPFAGNVAYNLDTRQPPAIDPTPFLFALTALVLVWGFFRLRLLDLVPVARAAVMEQLTDGVLVLDVYGRVVDANPAAAALLGVGRGDLVGRAVRDVAPELAYEVDRHRAGGTGTDTEVVLERPGAARCDVALSLSHVTDVGGRQSAHVAVLRDITQRRQTEQRLRELLADQTRLSETLQQSLRPTSLPELPGLELAARSVPAGRGGQVSGDFYDVHPAADGRWAFVLGDVSGKGVHAAVVTSIARYTVRTLSAQGWAPHEVLDQLNQALLASEDVERFCTVVYGQLTLPEPGADIGVQVTLALGGHPQPLLRGADGTVTAVGTPGTALGLVPEVDVHDSTVELAAGDVLLAFTDGVIEARRDGELFGEQRLADALAEHGGGAPDDVAGALLAALARFGVEGDDVALLVLARPAGPNG
jgi:PAS domain S-box-containing protein